MVALLTSSAVSLADSGANPQQQWWDHLSKLCGKSFQGALTAFNTPTDDGWRSANVVMFVESCQENEIRIPLHVGENRSRTWILTRNGEQIRLKHQHKHEDGTLDAVTWYGGTTSDAGTSNRQTFPVDDYSKALFLANGLPASITNFWNMEVHEDKNFIYELVRPGRHFRVSFDITKPVQTPPKAW